MSEPCAIAQSVTPTTGTFPAPWWKKILTGKDNQTWDLGRISWAGSFLWVIAHDVWQLRQGAGASLKEVAVALAAIAGAHGAALGFKAKTEPGGDA